MNTITTAAQNLLIALDQDGAEITAQKEALRAALAMQDGQSNFCAQCEALARELKAIKQEGDAITLPSDDELRAAIHRAAEAAGPELVREFFNGYKQEQGEPVAVIGSDFQLLYCRNDWQKGLKVGDLLYTTPQQRTWVGLTDDERNRTMLSYYARTEPLAEAIEDKLKEKNGL
jgi:hypothetical protein